MTAASAAGPRPRRLLAAVRGRWTLAVVRGHSMAPTLADGERLLVSRVRRPPRRGEVVVFTTGPSDPPHLVKRVVAVPGDPTPSWVPGAPPRVPPGFVVVAGDNPHSLGSAQLGLVSRAVILGVVRGR